MPTDVEHLSHGNHNIDFLSHIFTTQFNDWIITAGFYSSLHIFEYAIFKTENWAYQGKKIKVLHSKEFFPSLFSAGITLPNGCTPKSSDHLARGHIVNWFFREISAEYYRLFNASMTARYVLYRQERPITEKRIKEDLLKIIQWGNNRFSTTFKSPTLS